jgi:hypothetical protein
MTCPHCGGPLTPCVAFLTSEDGCERVELPGYCPSAECQKARDDAAVARLIERGVIDP